MWTSGGAGEEPSGLCLRQINKHVEQLDESRRQDLKRYQMMKEHERREYLKSLKEEKRQEEQQRYQEAELKHADHPRINHPVRPAESAQPSAESAGLTQHCFLREVRTS